MVQVGEAGMRVGVVGVGTMGALVVSGLVQAGRQVVACDADDRCRARARELGATVAAHPEELAGQADVILLVLPGPRQIEAVLMGEHGLASAARAGQIVVDMSTVDPESTRRMGAQLAPLGVTYLDAPILGRPSAAGRWVLPVGGDPEALERCRPVLEAVARKVIHVGPLGAGDTIKALNALMFSAINAMTAEMMAIAAHIGMSPQVVFETIAGSDAATVSPLFKEVAGKIVARDFERVFSIDLLCKDNGLAISMAKAGGAPPVLASTVQMLNELAQARGLGSEDTSALVKLYEALLGTGESCS